LCTRGATQNVEFGNTVKCGVLKKYTRGTRFCDDDEFKQAPESYLDSMPQEL